MKSAIIGYPYIGEKEQWIEIREQFRTHKISSNEFKRQHIEAMITSLRKQKEMGLDILTIGDYSMLDRMLDMAFMFNLIPSRFTETYKKRTIELYFDMAYGNTATKCTLNNWFATSYCYIEPEFENNEIKFNDIYFKEVITQCKDALNCVPRVTLIGPMTFMSLTKGIHKENKKDFRNQLLNGYLQLFEMLQQLDVEWVQLEEPILANSLNSTELALVRFFYQQLTENSKLKVMLTIPYEMPQHVQTLADLPIAGLGVDITKNDLPNLHLRRELVIGLGVIEATNIWSIRENDILNRLRKVKDQYPQQEYWLQTNASLMHIPVTKKEEWLIERDLFKKIAFADEKIVELVYLTNVVRTCSHGEIFEISSKGKYDYNIWPLPMKKGNRANIGRRWRLQQAFLQLQQVVLTTNAMQMFDEPPSNVAYKNLFTASIIDLPAYMPCTSSKLIELVAENLLGMTTTKFGAILLSFQEVFKPPIQYDVIQWKAPIFLPYIQQLKKEYAGNLKLILPGPITMVKSAFLQHESSYEMSLHQMIQAFKQEIQSFEHRNIQMLQFEESWLYRKLPIKFREQQKQIKLELDMLNRCISIIREMIVVQVRTFVWKKTFNELIKMSTIDVLSLDSVNEQFLDLLLESSKSIKVVISINVSSFITDGRIDWQRINQIKAAFKQRMLWYNVDLPKEELSKYNHLLKELKKEKKDIPLRYISD